MEYKELGMSILDKIGGNQNVKHLTHCATRLRFTLNDEKKIKIDELKRTSGILGVVENGPQLQVIIGSDVSKVFQPISEICQLESSNVKNETNGVDERSWVSKFIDTVSGIFTPILPPLTAAGMLKAVLAILLAFKVIDNTSETYQIINFMADTTFYFLPIILANSSARRFKCNPYLAMMLGAVLIHPNFIGMVQVAKEAQSSIHFLGIPVYLATYTSSVIPIILGVWFMSKVEPIADKVSPKAIKFFTSPLITIFIASAVTLIVLGPIGFLISNGIASVMNTLNDIAGWIVPTLIGTITPLLVMTGTHHGLLPIGINNRLTIGYDTIVYPGQLGSNIAQGAAALAISIKTKNKELKQLASATGITAVCGITEPVLFGITIKYRSNLIASMIGGGLAGLFMGIFNVRNFSGGSPGLLTLPSYISVDAPLSNFYLAIAGAGIAFSVSFCISYILFKDIEKQELVSKPEVKDIILEAPVTGEMIPLSKVQDQTFASELLGKSLAIKPSIGHIYAPVSGRVISVFPTKHALTIQGENGEEIMIHIGIDTVSLNGDGFISHIKDGDRINKGQLLMDVDLENLSKKNIDSTVMTIILNSKEYKIKMLEEYGLVKKQDKVCLLSKENKDV